jgi:hypothetical protein
MNKIKKILSFFLGSIALSSLLGCATAPVPETQVTSVPNYVQLCSRASATLEDTLACAKDQFRNDSRVPAHEVAIVDFLLDVERTLKQKVQSGMLGADQAHELLEAIAKRVESGQPLSADLIAQSGVDSSHPYLRAFVVGSPANSSDRAPCVYATCGPVQVNGYYRKDGTYVRPHTRSAPSSGGRRR